MTGGIAFQRDRRDIGIVELATEGGHAREVKGWIDGLDIRKQSPDRGVHSQTRQRRPLKRLLIRPLGAILFFEGFGQPHPIGSEVQPSGLVKFRLGRLRVRATLFRSRAAFFDLLFPHNDGA